MFTVGISRTKKVKNGLVNIINLVVCRLNIYVGKERMHVFHVVIMVVMP